MNNIYFVLFLFFTSFLNAQDPLFDKPRFDCGYRKSNVAQSQDLNERMLSQHLSGVNNRQSSVIYKLPVVVHVVTASSCEDFGQERYKFNPSDERIRFEINEASLRFRHQHSSARKYANPYYGIDTEFELAFATVDTNGNFTSGINRIVDPSIEGNYWYTMGGMLDKYKWDTKKYCNIFIVTDLGDASGAYLEGYDFTIYDWRSYWSGLICHELGHYLGLYHTFESEAGYCPENKNCLTSGDHVCDTPPKYEAGNPDEQCDRGINPTNTCFTDEADSSTNNPYRAINLGGMGDQPDMSTNYMDYTGKCWDSFTLGQKNRMRASLSFRPEMISFAEIAFANQTSFNIYVKKFELKQDNCDEFYTPEILIENRAANVLNQAKMKILDGNNTLVTLNWIGNLLPGQSVKVSFPSIAIANDVQSVELAISEPNGLTDAVFVSGSCKKTYFQNYPAKSPLALDFNTCKDLELRNLVGENGMKWIMQPYREFYYHTCGACSPMLTNEVGAAPYSIKRASFDLPVRDFSSFQYPEMRFKFSYLGHVSSAPFDTLAILVSANCGSFNTVWQATGDSISTFDPSLRNTDFRYSPSCYNTKDVRINLSLFAGQEFIQIRILAKGIFRDFLMFDEVEIDNNPLLGIEKVEKNKIHILNPVEEIILIYETEKSTKYQIWSMTGQLILETKSKQIEVGMLPGGIYLLVNHRENSTGVQKFVKR
jgi:hypothetical protein